MLDWEHSTRGHPLAGLGKFLAVQELPSDYLLPGLAWPNRGALGIADGAAQAQRCFDAMGQPTASCGGGPTSVR